MQYIAKVIHALYANVFAAIAWCNVCRLAVNRGRDGV